jgi:hypothetical protein
MFCQNKLRYSKILQNFQSLHDLLRVNCSISDRKFKIRNFASVCKLLVKIVNSEIRIFLKSNFKKKQHKL